MKKILHYVVAAAVIFPFLVHGASKKKRYKNKNGEEQLISSNEFRFGVGSYFDTKTDKMTPYFTMLSRYWSAGVGASFTNSHNGDSRNVVFLQGFAGGRYPISEIFYFTGGASVSWGINTKSHEDDPYVVGPYVGFDVHIGRNILINTQIMPYARKKSLSQRSENEVFREGILGISYLF